MVRLGGAHCLPKTITEEGTKRGRVTGKASDPPSLPGLWSYRKLGDDQLRGNGGASLVVNVECHSKQKDGTFHDLLSGCRSTHQLHTV